ncbi:MAG: GHKL domain-containing protein [Lachnospiraceae bacterium]|nr:GHKL domain-containing protein [Lachnospiraceae bacterium]
MDSVTVFKLLSAPYSIIFHIVMFFMLNEYRYPRKKAALMTAFLNVPIIILTVIMYLLLGSERGGQLAILFYILPQIAVSFFLSRYHDGRVFSTYFFVSGIFIFIIQVSNLLDYYSPYNNYIVMFLVRLIAFPITLFLMISYLAKPYRRVMNVLRTGWNMFAYISGIYTFILLVVFNFPNTLSKRPHDIPVLVLVFAAMLLTGIYCIKTLLSQHNYYQQQELNHYLEQQMEMMQQKINHAEEAEKNITIYRHDLRHILTTLGVMLSEGSYDEASSYIEQNIGVIEQDTSTKWCGNPILNAMFTAYFAEAKKQNIEIIAQLEISDVPSDKATVLSLVFANAIENAIHAVSELPSKDRVIRVKAIQSPQLMFSVSNHYSGSIMLDENGVPTSGEEGHGIGIRSMLAYCERNNAVCDFKISDEWFAVRIVKR